MAKSKHYKLNIWADGFGKWHCQAIFNTPLENTGEAERILFNARRGAHWAIRNEVQLRQGQPMGKLRLKIAENKSDENNLLSSITWSEK